MNMIKRGSFLTCTVPGCGAEHYSKGFCSKHYQRFQRHGDASIVHGQPRTVEDRFWAQVEKSDGCWLWKGSTRADGYGRVTIGSRADKTRATVLAHRLSWAIATGIEAGALNVLHQCDVPACVKPEHLFLGTHLDNMRDMVSKGRSSAGARHGNSKLSVEQVRQVLVARETSSQLAVAQMFNVSRSLVSMIENGKRWANADV